MNEWYGEFAKEVNKKNLVAIKLYVHEPVYIWAYTTTGVLRSISKELTAAILAEQFPDTIYFVATMVTHPDYEK